MKRTAMAVMWLAVYFLSAGLSIAQQTRTWNGPATGDWFTAANWLPGGAENNYPQSGDTVVITNSSVLLTNETAELTAFTITNATMVFSNWNTRLRATTVTVRNKARLTLPGAFGEAPAMSNRVWIVCHDFTLESGGTNDVTACGYVRFRGPGAGGMNVSGNNGGGGGGNGGWGGRGSAGGVGATNGTPEAPTGPGSGGGGYSDIHADGGGGGGAVRIEASGTVLINGDIIANGGNAGTYGGGGSGGSVFITCDLFGGSSGRILANGGNGGSSGGKGGGGRIAVIYSQLTGTPAVSFSANSATNGWSPAKDINMPTYPAAPHIGSLYFSNPSILNGLLLDGGTRINGLNGYLLFAVPGTWPPASLTQLSQCTIGVSSGQTLEFSQGLTLNGGGLMVRDNATLQCNGNLVMTNSARMAVYSGMTNGVDVVDGALVRATGALVVASNCWIYPFAHNTNGATVRFEVGQLSVAAGGGINADFAGYRDRFGPGKGTDSINAAGGGGFGGKGGSVNGGTNYGNALMPVQPGSGGGRYDATHSQFAHGGGAVRIYSAGPVSVDGTITANGQGNGSWAGGGSGGGIYIVCSSFGGSGSARLQANGGNGGTSGTTKGGGGGGRIAVVYGAPFSPGLPEARLEISETRPASYAGAAEVLPGTGSTNSAAEFGSLRFVKVLPIRGTLIHFR